MSVARWSVVAVAALLLAGCGGQAHRSTHGRTLHLTWKDDDHKGIFVVKPHETIVLTLPFKRQPGYRWQSMVASPMLGFQKLSQRYVVPKNGVPDAIGKEIWRYRPVGRGGASLAVFYGKLNPQHTRWIVARRLDVGISTS
jgi:predicted secreted protein